MTESGLRPRSGAARTWLPEVQALRALAVALVVLYHVWPDRLTGGYIGVDVFFVISGYLITSHLIRERERDGRISLTGFWARRIRRLLPAAFIVLAVCVVLLLTVFPAVLRADGLRQIAFAGVYSLNWLLGLDAVDYLGALNEPTLVQHYWTLSVEEQFYIAWPIVLVLALVAAARFGRGRTIPVVAVVGAAAVVVTGASFAYALVSVATNPAFAYFDTGVRAWEFGAGAILAAAVIALPRSVDRLRELPFIGRSWIIGLVGSALILGSAVLLTSASSFPGLGAVPAVLGTVLVILAGLPDRAWIGPVLRWRPIQVTGDISYEIYLVHWPVLIAFGVLVGEHWWWQGLVIIVITVAAAAALHAGARALPGLLGGLWKRRWPAFAFAAVGALAFAGAAVAVPAPAPAPPPPAAEPAATTPPPLTDPAACIGAAAMLSGARCSDRLALPADVDAATAAAAADLDQSGWCLTWLGQDWLQCERGDLAAANGTIALVGDSHGAAMLDALDEYFAQRGWKIVTYLRFGCSGLTTLDTWAPEFATDSGQEFDCRQWSERVRDEIAARDDIDVVLVANFAQSYSGLGGAGERWTVDEIVGAYSAFASSGKRVAVLEDVPVSMSGDIPTCVATWTSSAPPCTLDRAVAVGTDPQLVAIDRIVADGGAEIPYVRVADAFCDPEACYTVIGGVVAYADANHVSGTFARSLMPFIGPSIEAAIAPPLSR